MKTLKLYLETLTAPSTTIEVVLQLAENVAHEAVAAVIAEKQSMQKPGRMAEMEDAMREEEWEFYRRFFVDVRTADDDDDHEAVHIFNDSDVDHPENSEISSASSLARNVKGLKSANARTRRRSQYQLVRSSTYSIRAMELYFLGGLETLLCYLPTWKRLL